MSAPQSFPVRTLPGRPSFQCLRNQAKQLRARHAEGDPDVCRRIVAVHPDWQDRSTDDVANTELALADAQLVIAREYGFDSWPKLKAHVEAVSGAAHEGISTTPDRMLRDQVQALAVRHETYADLLKRTLVFSGLPNETTVDVSRSTYGDYIASLPNPCCVYTFFAVERNYHELSDEYGPMLVDYTSDMTSAVIGRDADEALSAFPVGREEATAFLIPFTTTLLAHFERVWETTPSLAVSDAELEVWPSAVALVERRRDRQDEKVDIPDTEPVTIVTLKARWSDREGAVRFCYVERTLRETVYPVRLALTKRSAFPTRLEGPDRVRVAPLFAEHVRGRLEIDSVIEDQSHGIVVVDDESNPTVAQVTLFDEGRTLSTNTWYGGDLSHPILEEWITHPPSGVVPESPAWEDRLVGIRGVPDRRVPCYEYDYDALDPAHLETIANRITDDVRIDGIDLDLARRIVAGYVPSFANNFASLEDFVERGIGFCALVDDEPALVVSSNVVSKTGIRPGYKMNPAHGSARLPLSSAATAALLLACLEESREVHWHITQVRGRLLLAERLGFVPREP